MTTRIRVDGGPAVHELGIINASETLCGLVVTLGARDAVSVADTEAPADCAACLARICEGCSEINVATKRYRVTDHGGEVSYPRWCAPCLDLAVADWNGNTSSIETLGDDASVEASRAAEAVTLDEERILRSSVSRLRKTVNPADPTEIEIYRIGRTYEVVQSFGEYELKRSGERIFYGETLAAIDAELRRFGLPTISAIDAELDEDESAWAFPAILPGEGDSEGDV